MLEVDVVVSVLTIVLWQYAALAVPLQTQPHVILQTSSPGGVPTHWAA